MEDLIQISKLNDFIFCPFSIYLHTIYDTFRKETYQEKPQKAGTISHKKIDYGHYSTKKNILQGKPIYSEKYGLIGKVDIFDVDEGMLVERKRKVKQLFDGFKYQLYAQYFCLLEEGYKVKTMLIHSLLDNKRYPIPIPDKDETKPFKKLIQAIRAFNPDQAQFTQNQAKCQNCIYAQLCTYKNVKSE